MRLPHHVWRDSLLGLMILLLTVSVVVFTDKQVAVLGSVMCLLVIGGWLQSRIISCATGGLILWLAVPMTHRTTIDQVIATAIATVGGGVALGLCLDLMTKRRAPNPSTESAPLPAGTDGPTALTAGADPSRPAGRCQ